EGSRMQRRDHLVRRLAVDGMPGAVHQRRREDIPMTTLGMTIGGPLDSLGAIAKRCEDKGFTSLWIAETARTAYIQSAVALQATTTARVGTAIALAVPRSPVITAMTARDLSELSGGRF